MKYKKLCRKDFIEFENILNKLNIQFKTFPIKLYKFKEVKNYGYNFINLKKQIDFIKLLRKSNIKGLL